MPPGLRRPSAWNGRSTRAPSLGHRSESPTSRTTPIATLRRRSSGSPSAERSAVATSVKSVKLQTSPATIAYGRLLSSLAPPANTIGSTGRTQGESAVTMPATNATPMSRPTG